MLKLNGFIRPLILRTRFFTTIVIFANNKKFLIIIK